MAEATSKCHCSVPHCTINKQRQPYLSFHAFPSDGYLRKKWVHVIRREEGPTFTILRGSTFVCSRHFSDADYTAATGRKCLKKGTVPSRFIWNNWGETSRESVYERVRARSTLYTFPVLSSDDTQEDDIVPGVTAGVDHDYAVTPLPGDACMADKGFTIEKLLAEHGAKLIIPPFKTAAQFSKENAERTQAIARLRILVERAIRRVKEFHIWDTTVPLTLSGTVNQLWTNCCLMSNFQWPLDVKGHKGV